jgi:hypothetical protein
MKYLIPLVLVLTSCVSTRVENSTLIPAIVTAWPAVRADIMEATEPPIATIAVMDQAVEAESKPLLRQVPWGILKSAATEGIQNQLEAETIGVNGAILLLEQLEQFDAAMLQLQKPVLVQAVSPQVQGLPTAEERIAERRATLSYSNSYRSVR